DVEPFHLKEHRVVRRVGRVAAKHPTGRDHPERRSLALHRMYLNCGSLTTQRKVFGDVERVSRLPCRMTRRNIERVEVIETRFDLGPVLDGITHCYKHVFDPLPNKGDRMKMALSGTRARQRDIDLLTLERVCFRLR